MAVICGNVAAAFYVACGKALQGQPRPQVAPGALRLLAGRLAFKSSSKFSSTSAKRELEFLMTLREAKTLRKSIVARGLS